MANVTSQVGKIYVYLMIIGHKIISKIRYNILKTADTLTFALLVPTRKIV